MVMVEVEVISGSDSGVVELIQLRPKAQATWLCLLLTAEQQVRT